MGITVDHAHDVVIVDDTRKIIRPSIDDGATS